MIKRPGSILAIVCLTAFVASPAAAYRLWLSTDYTGGVLELGEEITVDVHIDTEGDTGLSLLSVAVVYPPDVLEYAPESSSMPEYILYHPGAGKAPPTDLRSPAWPHPGEPLPWPLANDQVNIDFMWWSFLPSQNETASDVVIATVAFKPIGIGSGEIGLAVDRDGNIVAVGSGQNSSLVDISGTIDAGSSIFVNAAAVPMLGTLALVLLAGGIAVSGRRLLPEASTRFAVVALVLFGAAVSAPTEASLPGDLDADGVLDVDDNCLVRPNGPLAGTRLCDDQEDADADGYGTPCDRDFDNDGAVSLADFFLLWNVRGTAGESVYDFYDCDGAISHDEISLIFSSLRDGYELPGPSGLACAGTSPCP